MEYEVTSIVIQGYSAVVVLQSVPTEIDMCVAAADASSSSTIYFWFALRNNSSAL